MEITITEALSEINLINKKIEKKQNTVMTNLVRFEHSEDLFKKLGGSEAFVATELQSIRDLRTRLVMIRSGIAKANQETSITVGKNTRSIFDWLAWRREVSTTELDFNKNVYNTVTTHQKDLENNPRVVKSEDGKPVELAKAHYHVDASAFLKESEYLVEVLEKLDGQLSLKNATVTITLQ